MPAAKPESDRWRLRPARRLSDLTDEPTVGVDYMVPTIKGYWNSMTGHWPVIGHRHIDRDPGEVQGPFPHWHVDLRFVPDHALTPRRGWPHVETLVVADYFGKPLVLRRRRCHRAAAPESIAHRAMIEPTQRRLSGRPCRRQGEWLVCPHRGTVLIGLKPDRDGIVVCPLHGLAIDATTDRVLDVGRSIARGFGSAGERH